MQPEEVPPQSGPQGPLPSASAKWGSRTSGGGSWTMILEADGRGRYVLKLTIFNK